MNKNLQITQNQQNFEFAQKIKDDCFQTWPAILACKGRKNQTYMRVTDKHKDRPDNVIV